MVIEENVVAEAGTVHYLTLDQIRDSISELGYIPRQRNVHYELMDELHEQEAVEANREWIRRRLEESQTPLVQLST
jgi:cyclic dehypoxanthinyl futalosine synthase